MSKEMTWVEAAIIALENSVDIWMTAPDLVKEIKRTGIRELRSEYPQAVRSLRSALNFQSRKENGLFLRREEEYSIFFALRKRLKAHGGGSGVTAGSKKFNSGRYSQAKSKIKKALATPPAKPLVNGLPSHPPSVSISLIDLPNITPAAAPSSPHPLLLMQPYTIEIDPSCKYAHNYCNSSPSTEQAANFCLPSPTLSMLGPIRTLHIYNETAPTNHRPVRQARMRKSLKDQENSSPDAIFTNPTHDATPTHIPPPLAPPPIHEVLRLETCHPVPSLLSEVACVRCTSSYPSTRKSSLFDEDPCKAQGERKCSGRFEIQALDPPPISSESELDDPDEDEDDVTSMDTADMLSESDSEFDDRLFLQPTPRVKLIMHKPLRRCSTSSCSEDMKTDGVLLKREESRMDSTSFASIPPRPLPPSSRQNRSFSTDLGRLQGPNSGARSSLRSTESRNLDSVKKPSSNGFVSSLNQLDQRRYVSSLFLPTSPLVGENMRSFLNMDAYKGLSSYQKRKLHSFLPSVDRGTESNSNILESSFNNAFYSSALREWQEHVALGHFTPEYKAKIRGEEKRRMVRAEDLWKKKFYEETWGDKKEAADDEKDSFQVPYYPHNLCTSSSTPTGHSAACLRAILDGYHRKRSSEPKESTGVSSNTPLPPSKDSPVTPTPTPIPTPTPPTSTPALSSPPSSISSSVSSHTSTVAASPGKKVKSTPISVSARLDSPPKKSGKTKATKSLPSFSSSTSSSTKTPPPVSSTSTSTSTSSPGTVLKNHILKKPPANSQSPKNKNLLPSLLKSKTKVVVLNKKPAVNKKASVKRLGTSNKSQLSNSKSLGKALLHSLHTHKYGQFLTRLPPKLPYQTLLSALEQASKDNTVSISNTVSHYNPPSTQHTHSVFHDHFALLSNEHLPTEFSLPIKSLTIKLSRDIYHNCLTAKVIQREHSYCKAMMSGESPKQPRQQQQQQQQQCQRNRHQEHKRDPSLAELKLSFSRSLIRTKENCACDGRALVFCSRCHSLYHNDCVGSEGTLCPKCATLASLLAS